MRAVTYHPKRTIVTRLLEFWNTPIAPGIEPNWEEEANKNGYYTDLGNFVTQEKYIEAKEKMKMTRRDKDFKELIEAIVDEHYQITKKCDQNLNYLWHLYKKGTKAGEYKPFILMAEMQLLKEMGYITDEEIQNMWAMLDSEDEDNFYLVWLAVRTWRLTRITEHGVYGTSSTFAYSNIERDYPAKILNHEVFLKTMKQ
jgi:hypothetical protein